jgi:hypothetical protein
MDSVARVEAAAAALLAQCGVGCDGSRASSASDPLCHRAAVLRGQLARVSAALASLPAVPALAPPPTYTPPPPLEREILDMRRFLEDAAAHLAARASEH